MRRRALALLLYLATRPSMTATREQVLESLWPEADPESATNSLHQTLFFLRRDIEPWFDEDTSFTYVSNEGDLVWLDDHLVAGVSATFVARVASLPLTASPQARAAALEMYTGKFAPEFEYEDWAMAWRDRLHAQFLALGELHVRDQWETGSVQHAIATAQRMLGLDADAVAFEAALVALYAQTGAEAAAAKQYEHYAARYREVVGAEPEEMAKVVALTPARLRTVH